MQPTGSGGGLCRGLARFRSAPATWLEALLESEEVEVEVEESILDLDPPPKQTTTPTQSFAPPPTAAANKTYVDPGLFSSPGSSAFLRQNSSPAEFLTQISSGSVGYFSKFGIPANYDYLPSSKRPRETVEKSGELHGLLDAEMKKILEDSIPCRIRAKRGCATHPRSIAERVRRTRISDRIRKLQELVPNMDKQTNTADMLDEAVEYVKFLQKQIQELTDHEKKCVCAARN